MSTYVRIDHQRKFNCRNGKSSTKLTGNTPAQRYQKQKLIYNTVRVPSSIYSMNLGALNVYQHPSAKTYGVNWNQASDRVDPHLQPAGSSGGNPGGNSTKRSVTRLRPGALAPGGAGVDIKHNSYDRYLARLKGKKPLRQQAVPSSFAKNEIPFNRADPIYGGKMFKLGIIEKCVCEPDPNRELLYSGAGSACLAPEMYEEVEQIQQKDKLCVSLCDAKKNQYYGYSTSDSFLLQCEQAIECGDIIPVL